MQNMSFERNFDLPPDQVFSYFAEHENLEPVLGAKMTRISDGTDGNRNGVGSVRGIKPPFVPGFEETITVYEPNDLIVYTVTKGTPLNHHLGEVTFTPTADGGTHLLWKIEIDTALPGLDFVIAQALKMTISKGLKKVDPKA